MQVFLPYPDLKQSVCCLDPKRLGNQVYRECLTIIRGSWPNHPVSKMWADYIPTLAQYALYGVNELKRRGLDYYNRDWYHELADKVVLFADTTDDDYFWEPPWLGNESLHSSHRAALLYKDYNWYSKFGWSEQPAVPNEKGRLPYYWPVVID